MNIRKCIVDIVRNLGVLAKLNIIVTESFQFQLLTEAYRENCMSYMHVIGECEEDIDCEELPEFLSKIEENVKTMTSYIISK